MQSYSNHRHSTRVEVYLKSWVRIQDGVFRTVRSLDLSREGASLAFDFELSVGQELVLCLKLGQEAPLALSARVVWVARGCAGVQFTDRNQPAWRRLLRFHWVEVSKAAVSA